MVTSQYGLLFPGKKTTSEFSQWIMVTNMGEQYHMSIELLVLECKYVVYLNGINRFSDDIIPWERQGLSSIPSTMLTISLPMPVALWERTDGKTNFNYSSQINKYQCNLITTRKPLKCNGWEWRRNRHLDMLSPSSSSPSQWKVPKPPLFSEPTPSCTRENQEKSSWFWTLVQP